MTPKRSKAINCRYVYVRRWVVLARGAQKSGYPAPSMYPERLAVHHPDVAHGGVAHDNRNVRAVDVGLVGEALTDLDQVDVAEGAHVLGGVPEHPLAHVLGERAVADHDAVDSDHELLDTRSRVVVEHELANHDDRVVDLVLRDNFHDGSGLELGRDEFGPELNSAVHVHLPSLGVQETILMDTF